MMLLMSAVTSMLFAGVRHCTQLQARVAIAALLILSAALLIVMIVAAMVASSRHSAKSTPHQIPICARACVLRTRQ